MRRRTEALGLIAALLAGCADPAGDATGRVRLADEPAAGVEVTLVGPVTRAMRTDEKGVWLARGLPAGGYLVTAAAEDTFEGAVSTTLTVTPSRRGEAEALTLTPVGEVRGRVVGPAEATVVVPGVGGTRAEEDGTFRLARVPVGLRDVVAWAPGHASGRAVAQVRRGEVFDVGPITLRAVDEAGAPTVGTLEGRARVPGTDDYSGITVELEGTSRSVVTAADGSFRFADVPAGVVGLSFRHEGLEARLPRVMVVPGTNGFVVGATLAALDAAPVRLRLGTAFTPDVSSFSQATWQGWAVGRRANGGVFLVSPSLTVHEVSSRPPGRTGTEPFQLGFRGGDYWEIFDGAVLRVQLEPFAIHQAAATAGYSSVTALAAAGSGVAWIEEGTLYLKASDTAPVVERFTHVARRLVALDDGTVLVVAEGALHHLRLDGTTLGSTPLPQWAGGALMLSPDERTAVLNGVESTPGFVGVAVDRASGTVRELPRCYNAAFSPDSTRLWCGGSSVLTLATGDWDTFDDPDGGVDYGKPAWLPDGALAVPLYDVLLVLRPGRPTLRIPGFSWRAPSVHVTASQRLRVFANFDEVTGLGQGVEVDPAAGTLTVLADAVVPNGFIALDSGLLVARPEALGTDVQLVFVANDGTEQQLGRTTSERADRLSRSPDGRYVTGCRFVPARGYEGFIFDTQTGASRWDSGCDLWNSVWGSDRSLLYVRRAAPPFFPGASASSVELP